MRPVPTAGWLALYESKKDLLAPPADLPAYFTAANIAGIQLDRLSLGNIHFPTGDFLVCDPLVYLGRSSSLYFQPVPVGSFPLTACVAKIEEDHYRFVAVQVLFSDEAPVRFTEALIGSEDLENLSPGEYYGFNVDAGLGTIADAATRDAYMDFYERWTQDNPGKNIYDDYFAAIFAQSYKDQPLYQRKDGDYINWTIPGTELSLPMFQSGFGDGAYPVYMGWDAQGAVCQLIIQFIDLELAFGEQSENDA
jgi:hypothetical protein